ncbi:MAG: 50S ribosomal protein L5 [Candidatus Altiarchaeum hamiconexum]|uniref:50S ribosomal protein L5 n=1 Tax=Candidatus Altarchaeum hamiconexum TaxID=1803513 RepID=A0A8J7YZD2_9ARCH|nr:50S ribosomal protein L5 [Candidatus Altarchaeum hamiconexum]OIQ04874.1 MAG: 50S ribosomal protein L5 [Candidatus Altarchaeum sp. CG2_30_32_3053]PIN67254.1 MAG: 50S ribosomal protein L5 [Candidatus Altarchaeum sp. CG12_big_fil_rev_8_21_14_0_65_33_22]PIV27665.1 MAG: 50S ribosomal protein L5 [Candidatus Altarchaeum sp. CG03_land_8_20_14_0_80_32_618]PIX48770.1 MAG: 50S ribosomal protein L5 [Candidatus Altarchaeum sp. CG_4_8_14_3_um_filter_33_2054]PIZ29615.1 MAG: 50S ribosomal protein L5 [Candi
MDAQQNPMRDLKIEKVVLNIGVGQSGERVEKAWKLLNLLTKRKPIKTISKKRIPTWNLKKKEAIGVKVTLRGKDAEEILKRCLEAVDWRVKPTCFDGENFSFGIKEYIDIPGMKYIMEIGNFGLNINAKIERNGYSIMRRKIKRSDISNAHRVKGEEAEKFITEKFKVNIIKKEE